MPSPQEIVEGLTQVARGWAPLAVVWHVVVGVAVVLLARGRVPTRRTAGVMLAAPLVSVGVLAAVHGNPFNAIVLGAGAVALAVLGARLPVARVVRVRGVWRVAAVGMIGFGWAYPHFLEGGSPWVYLVAAPVGLVPCPTLSVVIGLALLGQGLGARAWSTVLAVLGLFYGVFGALRLGVAIDGVLVLGALALLARVWGGAATPTRASRVAWGTDGRLGNGVGAKLRG